MNYKATPIAVSVHREGINPIFGDGATHVCLEDEAGGPFIVLKQSDEFVKVGEVRFDIEELEVVLETAKSLIAGWPKDE